MWPGDDAVRPKADFAAPGVTFPKAEVLKVQPNCGQQGGQEGDQCAQLDVRIVGGASDGDKAVVQVSTDVAESGLTKGDRVELIRIPGRGGVPSTFSFFGVERQVPVGIMTALFVLVVAAVARLRGILALVGLGIAGLVVAKFMLPALLAGSSGVAVALVGSAAIMFVVLYLAHGLSLRTSTALAGTLLGIAVTAGLGWYAVHAGRLSGVGDDDSGLLSAQVKLDFQGLLMCALIIAALGILNDVTITQSSAVWELRAAAPGLSRAELFASGMRIGRDHIASTIYTIVFAYAGAALAVLLLVQLYDRPLLSLLSSEAVGQEVMRTLAGGIGLVLAVPITTAVAALVVGD